MKIKCPECGIGKARRECPRRDNVEICSACCAAIRGEECGDCVHYAESQQRTGSLQHGTRRGLRLSGDDYLAEISDEINTTVDNALALAQAGNPKKAMSILTALLPAHPLSHILHFGIGTIHVVLKNHAEAIRWFDKAIAIFPYCIEAHYNKAACHQNLMDIPKMVFSYRKVVEHGESGDPDVKRAKSLLVGFERSIRKAEGVGLDEFLKAHELFNQAFALMEQDDWTGALDLFTASAAIHNRSAQCHGNMGLCHAYMGSKTKALEELDHALAIKPDYAFARENRKMVAAMAEGEPLTIPFITNAPPTKLKHR